ncbi:carboxypeptidase A4-like [Glandiceps talaboti]
MVALNNKKDVVLIMLDLSAAFDTIDHSILLNRLEFRFGVTGTALAWFKSYLLNRHQRVKVTSTASSTSHIKYGVPQGSVLGPILFTLYTAPLEDVIIGHGLDYMMYADDSEIYTICNKPADILPDVETCIDDIRSWMRSNMLVLNDDKTAEVIQFSSRLKTNVVELTSLKIGGLDIAPSTSVRNLGVTLRRDGSMSDQISHICKNGYFSLYKIGKIRKLLDKACTEKLIHAFVTSRLDYCNGLLYGIPKYQIDRLQSLQNAAARLTVILTLPNNPTISKDELNLVGCAVHLQLHTQQVGFATQHQLVTLVLVCCLTLVAGEIKRFEGYQVLRVKVHAKHDLSIIKDIESTDKYDFWNYPSDIMTAPSDAEELKRILLENNIEFEVWIKNVQDVIDNQFKGQNGGLKTMTVQKSVGDGPAVHDFDYTVYHRYAEIDQWIKDTAAKFSDLAQEFILGRSYQRRVMRGLKVGTQSESMKPTMWIESGIHAREWITPATNMWMTNKMLTDYGNDTLITRLLDDYDLYLLFSMNPDGYEYTWSDDRLWRKTRSPNLGSSCIGTDANRNWDFEWGGDGVSFDPCSNIYCGPYPSSEIEVENVINFLKTLSSTHEIKFFMDIHSAGNMFLNPWGYTSDRPTHYDDHIKLSKVFADAVEAVRGTTYRYGTIPELLYPASGSSLDYGHGLLKIKFSHGLEISTGYGFLLPEDQILPTAEETYAGMRAAYDYIMQHA